MARLILIRHAEPTIDPDLPPPEWALSPAGKEGAARLADQLTDREIGRIFSSGGRKAIQTAEIVGGRLGLENRIAPPLHEHDRTGVGFLEAGAFQAAIKALFEQPSEMVFGQESASAAVARFRSALDQIESRCPEETSIACATHGTIMSLFTATLGDTDGYSLWKQLKMPATIEIGRKSRAIVNITLSY